MKFKNIQVAGITNVVFVEQNTVYRRGEYCDLDCHTVYYWKRDTEKEYVIHHETMLKTIRHFSERDDAHVWIHGDTFNIRYPMYTPLILDDDGGVSP